jgi:DNA-3-methyladenine glycosylase II
MLTSAQRHRIPGENVSMSTSADLHMFTGTLLPCPPFDFAKTLGFLHGFGPTGGEQIFVPGALTKAVTLQGRAVAFELHSSGTIEKPELAYTLYSEQPLSETDCVAIADRLCFFLSLDDDLRPFYDIGRADSSFAPVIERLYGLHQPKFLTPFEIACWAILGQRIPWRVAHRTKLALVERWGTSITLNGETYRAFPEPEQLAAVDMGDLASVVRNERKVEYLQAVIQFFNEVDEQFLRYGDYDEVAAKIRSIRGVGEWSSYFIMVRGLGRMERVSTVDQELAKAVAKVYNEGQLLAPSEMQRLLERYGKYQGFWALYLRAPLSSSDHSMMA